jgi:putative transposase
MHLFVPVLPQVPEDITEFTQQILRLLQLNLFEERDLVALLRGDPPCEKKFDSNQMS